MSDITYIEEAAELTEADYRKLLAKIPEARRRQWLNGDWPSLALEHFKRGTPSEIVPWIKNPEEYR